MNFVPKTAPKLSPKLSGALVPVLLALAGCGGGAQEAGESSAGETSAAVETAVPAGAATPTPGETPLPGATPSESPGATPTPAPTTTQAAASAPAVFNQCTACHSVDRGENGIGPSLAGVFGRRSGTLAGFEFSQAMKDAGLTWNQSNLDRYLDNPRGIVPGTTMAYNGVKDGGQRQAVIAYLRGL